MAASRWMVTGSWGTTERHNDQSRVVCSFTPSRTCRVVAPAAGLSRSGLRPPPAAVADAALLTARPSGAVWQPSPGRGKRGQEAGAGAAVQISAGRPAVRV